MLDLLRGLRKHKCLVCKHGIALDHLIPQLGKTNVIDVYGTLHLSAVLLVIVVFWVVSME